MATLESIDQVIAASDAAFTGLSNKLIGVQDDIVYRATTGTNGFSDPKLTGETKKVVDGVTALIAGIWLVANVVSKRLDEARAKRSTIKTGIFSGSGSLIQEVDDMLSAATLTMTPEAVDKMPELLKGQVFSRGGNVTSVMVALQACDTILKQAARSIIDIDSSRKQLITHIAEVEKRLAEVVPVVTKVGGSAQLAHSNALSALARAKTNSEFDPLGVTRTFDLTVDQHIRTINDAITVVEKAKEKAYAEYGDAQVLMQRLEDRQPNPERTPKLREWLDKLIKRLEQEEWSAASSGLEDWLRDASSVLATKPPASTGSNTTPKPQPPASVPNQTHAPAPYTPRPPVRTAPPPPVVVQQVPVSGQYNKYEPPEKSDLEKLLDGELKPAKSAPPPKPVEAPVDPALDKLLNSRTPASPQPSRNSEPVVDPNLERLVNGQTRPSQPSQGSAPASAPAPSTSTSAPPANSALDDLISGRKKPNPQGPAPVQTSTPSPAQSTVASPAPSTTPAAPPAPPPSSVDAVGDLFSGRKKPASIPAPAPAPAAPAATPSTVASPVPTTNVPPPARPSDASKLDDMFGGKKAVPPPAVPVPGQTLSQAEQDEAARKALEKLLKR